MTDTVLPASTPAHAQRPQPSADPGRCWRTLHRMACEPFRSSGRFAWHFARGKLGRDPVFRAMLERGWIPPGARLLDIGCGQGLLAGLMAAVDEMSAARSSWPTTWGVAPAGVDYRGIELMASDVQRAQLALTGVSRARFECADMRMAAYTPSDVVVILDVLHYVSHAEQDTVVARVAAALQPTGRLLLRVGDTAQSRRFAISQWVDRLVTRSRGHRVPPTYGRSVADWTALLQQHGFVVTHVPMSQGTPFANVLLVADLGRTASPASGTAVGGGSA